MNETTTTMSSPSDRRARRARKTMRAVLVPTMVAAGIFGATYHSAISSVDDAQPIDYKEECQSEGCAREEINELWVSYKGECSASDHGCWTEEIFELAGGPTPHLRPYSSESNIPEMFAAFRSRLGKTFTPYRMKVGLTLEGFTYWVDGQGVTRYCHESHQTCMWNYNINLL